MSDRILAPAWVEWLAENALRGASVDDLVAGLVAGGVADERARTEVSAVLASPILAAARRLVQRSAAVEQAARLQRAVDPGPLADRAAIDEDTLYREFWTAHRPVVVRGAAASWPAARWSAADLVARFGAVTVGALERAPGWWAEARSMHEITLGALLDGPPSDRWYADGRANLLERPGLEALRAELGVLPGIAGDGQPRAWVGPAGTVTPTHHDQSSAWLVQLVGRKRLHLASPLEPALATTAVGLYNTVDPREAQDGERADVRWHRLELGPTDAVLIPVGWWHHVEALEPSVSVSLGGFRWTNSFLWYLPGRR